MLRWRTFLLPVVAATCLAAASCGSAGGPSHADDQGGIRHAAGKEDPLKNCTKCHGADLKGGKGPNCYGCHDSKDHDVSQRGTMHRAGVMTDCTACHGPNNSGGLGPACSQCHH